MSNLDIPPEVRWTPKLPALVAGLALIGIGLLARSRRASAIGIILMALGLGFVGYSATIKDWCEARGQSAWSLAFGGSFSACLKAKGWFSF